MSIYESYEQNNNLDLLEQNLTHIYLSLIKSIEGKKKKKLY